MEFIKFARPKLPRNKYGLKSGNFYVGGGILGVDGQVEITDPDTNSSNTATTTIIYNSEWYNIQNKIVHGYQYAKDANDNFIMEPVVNEKGEYLYEADGVTILTKRKEVPYRDTWITVIENFQPKLLNTEQYRLVIMRYRKNKRQGKSWRIPMLSNRYWKEFSKEDDGSYQYPKMTWSEQDTWWKIVSAETRWWASSPVLSHYDAVNGQLVPVYRLKEYTDVLPIQTKNIDRVSYIPITLSDGTETLKRVVRQKPVFKNTRQAKMLLGVAIFKKTSEGSTGWQRVSNIATIQLKLHRNGHIHVQSNC